MWDIYGFINIYRGGHIVLRGGHVIWSWVWSYWHRCLPMYLDISKKIAIALRSPIIQEQSDPM